MEWQIITTADGSHTLYNGDLDEVYHSRNGALAESEHVFIRAGFDHAAVSFPAIGLLEVGFGTGLNALLTAFHCLSKNVPVKYLAFEPYPLDRETVRKLNYADILPAGARALWERIHGCPWGTWNVIHDHFHLMKTKAKVQDQTFSADPFNLVYFDAFAPRVQGELWGEQVFRKIHEAMSDGGILVTYSAQGAVRRSLETAGFRVERLPGPPGKREMIRASRRANG